MSWSYKVLFKPYIAKICNPKTIFAEIFFFRYRIDLNIKLNRCGNQNWGWLVEKYFPYFFSNLHHFLQTFLSIPWLPLKFIPNLFFQIVHVFRTLRQLWISKKYLITSEILSILFPLVLSVCQKNMTVPYFNCIKK